MGTRYNEKVVKHEEELWEQRSITDKWTRFDMILSQAVREIDYSENNKALELTYMITSLMEFSMQKKFNEDNSIYSENITQNFEDFMNEYGGMFGADEYFVHKFVTECIFNITEKNTYVIRYTVVNDDGLLTGSAVVKADSKAAAEVLVYDYIKDECDPENDLIMLDCGVKQLQDEVHIIPDRK